MAKKNSVSLKEMSQRTRLKNTRDNLPKQRGNEVRRLGPIPKCTELEAKTNFKGQCTNLEGYILDLGQRALEEFARTMKDLEQYLGSTYSNSCQPAIMAETPAASPGPDMPTIAPDTGAESPKTDRERIYLKKRNIEEAICQKLSNKGVYETYMKKIYNIIVGQKNKQIQEKAASDATFQAVKSVRDPTGYLIRVLS